MPVRLIPSQNYNNDRAKILDGIIDHALRSGNNAVPVLHFFRKEERDLHRRIKNSPLSAGVDFPKPVKKATTYSGNYVILYTFIPAEASTNAGVTRVNLDSILPTASGLFNQLVTDLVQVDFDE
jgi:hypothetical protein